MKTFRLPCRSAPANPARTGSTLSKSKVLRVSGTERAVEIGDHAALTKALLSGKVRVQSKRD
jgi:hypothetical protein